MKARRNRSKVEQSVRLTLPWDEVYIGGMTSIDRDLFQRRMEAVKLYLAGALQAEIWEKTKIQNNDLHRLMERCTTIGINGQVWGARALIPHYRIKSYQRVAPVVPRIPGQKAGYAGVLGQLLNRYPELYETLIKKVLKLGKPKDLQEFRIKPQALHKLFIDELKSLGHSSREWPFTTTYQGNRTIARFMKEILEQHFDKQVLIYSEAGAKAHLSVGTGKESVIRQTEVYDAWEVDSYKVDAEFVIGIRNADGLLSYINLKRLNILALVDRASTCVIWFLVVYNPEVSASDVVRLITESLRSTLPAPETNMLNMHIKGDAGFPGEKILELKHAIPTVLMPDNALSNLAASVSIGLRKMLGFFLNYGPPGHFECRPNVEHTFKNIANGIFKRFPNTTGASPADGRPKNGAEIARTYNIEAAIVEELAYQHFAQHNALETEGIGFLTPLEYMRQKLALANGHFIPRRLLNSQVDGVTHYKTMQKVKVRCYPRRGIRPYIQLDRVRYNNEVLRKSPWLNGIEISVAIDEQDMRTVRAFLPDGESLGLLTASGKWSRTKHTRKTRVAINQLKSKRLLTLTEMDDPVEHYLKYLHSTVLATGKVQAIGSKQSSKRGVASEISRVNEEISADRPDLINDYLGGELPQFPAVDDNELASPDCKPKHSLTTNSTIKTVMPSKIPDLKGLMKDF